MRHPHPHRQARKAVLYSRDPSQKPGLVGLDRLAAEKLKKQHQHRQISLALDKPAKVS